MRIKKTLLLLMIIVLITASIAGCKTQLNTEGTEAGKENDKAETANKTLILSTTTSTQDSGLLDYLLPVFTEDTGIEVKVVAVGTGKAIQMGVDGEADVLLVHAKSSEEEFVKAGHGLERFDVMYNDFVLVGPKVDPSKVGQDRANNIKEAFSYIASNKVKFVSRGDDSGTHKKEAAIWKELALEPSGEWYVSAGKGMGEVLQMADEMQAYTIADRATYLSMKDKLDIDIIVEKDKGLYNQYGVIAVNPNKNDKINAEGADMFVKWIISEKAQQLIGEFGKDKYGQSLFIPNAK
ncbi:MAG: substrate-binding domain-containing protein [Bacillota bacterium]